MDLSAKQARGVALPAETSDTCDEPGDDGVLDDADTLVSVDRTTTRLMTPSRSATPLGTPIRVAGFGLPTTPTGR
jgi:hypothetical protein